MAVVNGFIVFKINVVLMTFINNNNNVKDEDMEQQQKDAVINYIEFGLLSMIEKIADYTDSEKIVDIGYDEAYKILIDFDESFQSIVDQTQSTAHYR